MILLNGKVVKFETFPNGETKLIHTDLDISMDSHIEAVSVQNEVFFKYEDDKDLINLMFLKKYIDEFSVEANLIISYMPYSRMDRSENDSPFTLKYVANFINSLNFYEVAVIEPHSDVTCALLNNTSPYYINFDLVESVKQLVGFNDKIDYIVFPDAGAQKRYAKMEATNQLVGFKHRDFNTGKIESLKIIGDIHTTVSQSKAIIVDDLSSYGGTFVRTSQELKKLGVKEVYLLVAHAENSIFKGNLFNHIDKVFTTDSIITEQDNHSDVASQLHIFEIQGEIK